MNGLQKEIQNQIKKEGTEAYAYSVKQLGFDNEKTLEELYAGDQEWIKKI